MTHLIYLRSKNFLPLILSFLLTAFAFAQEEKEVSHTIYLTANTGVEKNSVSDQVLGKILEFSKEDQDSSTVVVLGNLTRKVGYPDKDNGRETEEKFLKENLLDPLEGYKGKIIFIPGKNEWNAKGHKSIDDLESYLQDNSEAKFWPNDGCPIERETLSDQVELVMVDSQWYLEDWDDHPYINNKCEIKTRKDFIAQFKDELKDEQNKTIIVALHHPVLSNNKKGFIGRMGGFSSQDYYSTKMQELIGQLETLAEQFNDVIFVSGNHRNLQYLDDDGVPQIISGATHKIKGARAQEDEGHYASKKNGFSKLTAYKDGSSKVDFYTLEDNNQFRLSFSKNIKSKRITIDEVDWQDKSTYGPTFKASVYTEEETDKSGLYKMFWGEHYRAIYSKKVEVPVLFLDDIPGNPKAISAGGGNQSRSLRLKDDNDHEFTIRELRKSAVRFIQASITDHYVIDYMQNTIAEDIVQDYYTTAHPYAPYAINSMLDELDIYHANPKIFYIPKQENLGRFNEDYGDKLYMYEAHVGDENKAMEIFGEADDILSTKDMILEFHEDKEAKIDESTYIRARIFDMLVGDWDRHQDQWRWAEFDQKDSTKIYKAIPRDRDQPFSKYDGFMVSLLKVGIPDLRVMQTYEPTIKSTKWFNNAGYGVDKVFINEATWEDWEKEAKFIQNQMTDEVIDKAFRENLPADAQDETIEEIKLTLKQRRANLVAIAKDYYLYFKKHEVVTGTEEDNTFLITRESDGKTKIEVLEDGVVIRSATYSKDETKEIWIYGLDGDDTFKVTGDGNKPIKLKILGGEENDIYDFERTAKTKIYDYSSKDNTYKNTGAKRLTDSYDINNYNYLKKIYSKNSLLPVIGSDPDAGFKFGLTNVFTKYGLVRNPFTAQHTLSVNFYSATQGAELSYFGEFAHIIYNWNLGIDARITNDKFALNYFGVGNETEYDNDTDKDYNRVLTQQWHFAPSLMYKESPNVTAYFKPLVESFIVSSDENNQLNDELLPADDVYNQQTYAGGEVGFIFNNKGAMIGYPRRGIELGIKGGYKTTIDKEFDNKFTYLQPVASFIYPIHESGAATLATKASAEFIFGDQYEFYHAATVGGNESLRGYRNDRFLGEKGFYQTTDLRVGLTKFKTNFVPIRLGVTAGFDYGRVWLDNDDSEKWHTSYGGSVFVNGFNALTANVGYYISDEDQRVLFSVGFRF